MPNKDLVKHTDPFDASLEYLLVIVFAKSTSKNFSMALNVAQGAAHFSIEKVNDKPVYIACFSSSKPDTGRALVVLKHTSTWKSTMVFANGELLDNHCLWVNEVLKCYMNAHSCRDPGAHCHSVVDDPFSKYIRSRNSSNSIKIELSLEPTPKKEVTINQFLFPCSFLKFRFKFSKDHPASLQDQIQSGAVSSKCDWCPNFDPDAWKKIGERKKLVDYFEQ